MFPRENWLALWWFNMTQLLQALVWHKSKQQRMACHLKSAKFGSICHLNDQRHNKATRTNAFAWRFFIQGNRSHIVSSHSCRFSRHQWHQMDEQQIVSQRFFKEMSLALMFLAWSAMFQLFSSCCFAPERSGFSCMMSNKGVKMLHDHTSKKGAFQPVHSHHSASKLKINKNANHVLLNFFDLVPFWMMTATFILDCLGFCVVLVSPQSLMWDAGVLPFSWFSPLISFPI